MPIRFERSRERELAFSQRSMAEIAELLYTANLIHRGVIEGHEISAQCSLDENRLDALNSANKLAILGGDFLLASSSMALAKLRCPKVNA